MCSCTDGRTELDGVREGCLFAIFVILTIQVRYQTLVCPCPQKSWSQRSLEARDSGAQSVVSSELGQPGGRGSDFRNRSIADTKFKDPKNNK
jgi:hypothetical protein